MNVHLLRSGRIEPESGGPPFAILADRDPTGSGLPEMGGCPRVAFGAATRGEDETGFATWGPAGRAAFESWCDRLLPALRERRLTALLRTSARDVLSDAPTCADFLRRREGQPFELLLDPCAMLTESMLPAADDHLLRIFESLGMHPRVGALVLPGPDSSAALLARRLCRPDLPVVIESGAPSRPANDR